MDPRQWFNSAENNSARDDDLKEYVKEKISQFIEKTNANPALHSRYLHDALQDVHENKWEVFESEDMTEKLGAIFKSALTATIWGFFFVAKNMTRGNLIEKNYDKFKNHEMTFNQCLVNILSSFIGQEDLHSFKYKLINHLFGLTANTDEEAKKIVRFTIEILSNDQELDMAPTSTASSRRLSGSEE